MGERLEGPKFDPEGPRAVLGFPTGPPTRGFRAFKVLCLALVVFK